LFVDKINVYIYKDNMDSVVIKKDNFNTSLRLCLDVDIGREGIELERIPNQP
jgi:hypothetical protein